MTQRRLTRRLTLAASVGGIVLIDLISAAHTTDSDRRHPCSSGGEIYMERRLSDEPRLWMADVVSGRVRALPYGVHGEPSHELHNGHRWFLRLAETEGEHDPIMPSLTLDAIRDDGMHFTLLRDARMHMIRSRPRWARHRHDALITWLGTRTGSASESAVEGLYSLELEFDPQDAIPLRVTGEPRLLVPCTVSTAFSTKRSPTFYGHDWSPDGSRVVVETADSRLEVVDVRSGHARTLPTGPACLPVWSPEGSAIAFKLAQPLGPIMTIRPDGTDPRPLVKPCSLPPSVTAHPAWSPDGRNLVYLHASRGEDDLLQCGTFWISADGQLGGSMTAEIKRPLVPTAWR